MHPRQAECVPLRTPWPVISSPSFHELLGHNTSPRRIRLLLHTNRGNWNYKVRVSHNTCSGKHAPYPLVCCVPNKYLSKRMQRLDESVTGSRPWSGMSRNTLFSGFDEHCVFAAGKGCLQYCSRSSYIHYYPSIPPADILGSILTDGRSLTRLMACMRKCGVIVLYRLNIEVAPKYLALESATALQDHFLPCTSGDYHPMRR